MDDLSRRKLLALGAVGGAVVAAGSAHAATFGNPDQPAEGAINSTPGALSNPGPQNPALEAQLPSFQNPPATDVGNMPMMWSSFNIMPKRIQAGGWARQITATEFPASTAVSGVNMRLGPGGIREMHWHLAGEWALMTNGRCRVTMLDQQGRAYVQDVGAGDLWFFPAGCPHSLQGLGPEGAEFLLVFDDAVQSEYNTLLLTDWIAHTPPDILARNFGVPVDVFKNIPLHDLWIFQGKEPPALARGSGRRRLGRHAAGAVHLLAHRHQAGEGERIRPASSLPTAATSRSPRPSPPPSRRSSPAASGRCTGTRMRTSGSTGSRARAA